MNPNANPRHRALLLRVEGIMLFYEIRIADSLLYQQGLRASANEML